MTTAVEADEAFEDFIKAAPEYLVGQLSLYDLRRLFELAVEILARKAANE